MLYRIIIAIFLLFTYFNQPLKGAGVDSLRLLLDTTLHSEKQIEIKLLLVEEIRNSDIRQALIFAKQALEEAEKLGARRLIAESRLAVGNCYNYLGASIEALENLSEALAIFDEINDNLKKALTLREIGNIYYYSREYDLALEYYHDVYNCGRALKDTSLMIKAIIGKGSVYGNTNKLDSALIIFNETFQLSEAINDKANVIHSLYNIGDVYRFTNRPNEALAIFRTIEKDYDIENINSRLLASLYNSITDSYIQLGDIGKAQNYSKKAWVAIQRYPRVNQKMTYYHLSFRIDTLLGNLNPAIKKYILFKQLSDSINSSQFKERLANFQTVYEVNAKEREIESLKLDNQLKDLSIKQRRIVNYGSLALVLLLLAVVFQTFRSISKSKAKNGVLQSQREELAAANEELSAINDELHFQREELQSTLEKLKSAQKQLISSEKMASLGLLAAGVAHEINNPLNFIKGGVLAIENYIKENVKDHLEEVSPLVEILNLGVKRAADIVISLNHYSRKDESKTTEVDIHAVIDNCLLMVRNQVKNRISIEKYFSNKPLTLECNEGKMHQAILNILTNSIHSICESGTIKIETKLLGKYIEVSITDTGCGISNDNLTKITDPFYTTKDPGKGTGLGLSITQNIIDEHMGYLEFESEIDKGTKVTIKLPLKNK